MKKTIAAPSEKQSRVCVITDEALDEKTLFVLPCCAQDIAKETIVRWLKQSESHGCPCCRDLTKARAVLNKLDVDLTPVERVADGPEDTDTREIFDAVISGIQQRTTVSDQCRDYRTFGLGLLRQNQRRLAHDLIDHLSDVLNTADQHSRPQIAKVILELFNWYEGRVALPPEGHPWRHVIADLLVVFQKWGRAIHDMSNGSHLS